MDILPILEFQSKGALGVSFNIVAKISALILIHDIISIKMQIK